MDKFLDTLLWPGACGTTADSLTVLNALHSMHALKIVKTAL